MNPARPGWRALKTKMWFSADLHFGHASIIEHCDRPFRTLDEMHEAIIARWNERVSPDDTVWLLGDIALGDRDVTLPLVRRLHGHKRLVAGNHDLCFHGRKVRNADGEVISQGMSKAELARMVQWYRDAAGFDAVITGEAIRRSGYAIHVPLLGGPMFGHPTVLVSHFPYTGESRSDYPDRYVEYRPQLPKRGVAPWLIHGHVHTQWAIDPAMHQINVGVDVWDFAPVGADELAALIEDFDPGFADRQLTAMEAAAKVREAKR
ncbi:metallophosphoesterase [Actinophytocola sp.]|uniref:metallophosphoesterase n=1 Tax=Actinophytocola sp. TaxID=1872138 RepID=UPI002D7F39E7|nr:metallophosphoesterase [Actinophytocola sp.]HET9144120.1 metallophosphoesterase [Actinophytocola sp.]